MSKYNLKTGDILLFAGNSKSWFFKIFDGLIRYFTNSDYTHIGMVLKDPTFIHPKLEGYYVWESGLEKNPDPQDGKKKFGVQITPIDEIIGDYSKDGGKIYYRKLKYDLTSFSKENLDKVHDVVYDKPYDINPVDWINAALKKEGKHPQNTTTFWCSAFVGYIYTQCGIIGGSTDWTILSPNDFSQSGANLAFINNCSLCLEELYEI